MYNGEAYLCPFRILILRLDAHIFMQSGNTGDQRPQTLAVEAPMTILSQQIEAKS